MQSSLIALAREFEDGEVDEMELESWLNCARQHIEVLRAQRDEMRGRVKDLTVVDRELALRLEGKEADLVARIEGCEKEEDFRMIAGELRARKQKATDLTLRWYAAAVESRAPAKSSGAKN